MILANSSQIISLTNCCIATLCYFINAENVKSSIAGGAVGADDISASDGAFILAIFTYFMNFQKAQFIMHKHNDSQLELMCCVLVKRINNFQLTRRLSFSIHSVVILILFARGWRWSIVSILLHFHDAFFYYFSLLYFLYRLHSVVFFFPVSPLFASVAARK